MKIFNIGDTVMFPDPSDNEHMILGQVLPDSIMKIKIVNNQIHHFKEYQVEPVMSVYGAEKYVVDSDELVQFNGPPPTPIQVVIDELCDLDNA